MNGDQQIEAPAKARPISKLTTSLGGTGLLGGATGTSGTDSGGSTVSPVNPNGPGTSTAPSGSGAPDADDFKRYADCLDKAAPEDTDALQRCAQLLNQ